MTVMTGPGSATSLRTDRRIAWMISLAGLTVLIGQMLPALRFRGEFPWWWNVGAWMVAGTVLLVAAAALFLPAGLLRLCWTVAPILSGILLLTSFAARQDPPPVDLLPWVWALEPMLVSYLVLWLPPRWALAGGLVSGALPALSALVFLGTVPDAVAVMTPVHMSNVAFVAIFLGIRQRLLRLAAAEALSRDRQERRIRARAEEAEDERLSRIVHDEVLSVLNAAMRMTGQPPNQLRQEAFTALELLSGKERPSVPDPIGADPGLEAGVEVQRGLDVLVDSLIGIDSRCVIDSAAEPGRIPALVVVSLSEAAAEALRNSVRHAGAGARRHAFLRMSPNSADIRIVDDGVGFDPAGIPPERLGVRRSILDRMRALLGGDAHLRSAPGQGTEVILTWRM